MVPIYLFFLMLYWFCITVPDPLDLWLCCWFSVQRASSGSSLEGFLASLPLLSQLMVQGHFLLRPNARCLFLFFPPSTGFHWSFSLFRWPCFLLRAQRSWLVYHRTVFASGNRLYNRWHFTSLGWAFIAVIEPHFCFGIRICPSSHIKLKKIFLQLYKFGTWLVYNKYIFNTKSPIQPSPA